MNSWTPARRALAIVTIVGGLAVVGSYAYGFVSIPGGINGLWGQTPDGIKGVYGAGMALGAAGFFAYTWHLLFGVDAARARVGDRFGYGLFVVLYALVLVPSALWLPLTAAMVEQPDERLWWAIRAVLFTVGLSGAALVAALVALRPGDPSPGRRWAIVGAVLFTLHTLVLDAVVWPALFR